MKTNHHPRNLHPPNRGGTRYPRLTAAALLVASIGLASCGDGRSGSNSGVATRQSYPGGPPPAANKAASPALPQADSAAMPMPMQVPGEDRTSNADAYAEVEENPFLRVSNAPLSTFSIDVDTASYSNARSFLSSGQLPAKAAVRIEEFVNYFHYDYEQPTGDAPFSVDTEIAECPWNRKHRLVRIGVQGKRIQTEEVPDRNLVFLVDVSGSMGQPNRLPLVKSTLGALAENLTGRDRIAIVVYAGSSGLVLPSTSGDRTNEIQAALGRLEAGGSTNGGQGIQLAYQIAQQNFVEGGVNRVILATDGDFNVGVTSPSELVRLVQEKRRGGVFLTVLGFGRGNLKDATMEQLADKGDGNYAYIDTYEEGRRVLVENANATLVTIAKDVKIQVEFNPRQATAYRLIGYENRALRAEDFKDDRKDAGEIGAGHSVTALYEVVPFGQKVDLPDADSLKYQEAPPTTARANSSEMLTVKLRYKEPEGSVSKELSLPVQDEGKRLDYASESFKFAASVASFGLLLRESKYAGDASFDDVVEMARASKGRDPQGDRDEFVRLVQTAKTLAIQRSPNGPHLDRAN